MASVVDKFKRWLRSPQARKARARAEQMARDPRTQAKARKFLGRFRKRH